MAINYARFLGIETVAPAVIFAILYVPLLAIFTFQLIRHGFYRLIFILTLFCSIRVTVFIIRAILAASSTAGTNQSLVIAEQVLVSIGFYALLFGAYGLALARLNLCDHQPRNLIERLVKNQRLFSIVGIVAISLSITSATTDDHELATTLRKTSIWIYLALTVLQTYHSLVLLRCENTGAQYARIASMTKFGERYGSFILTAISALLLVREGFTAATMSNLTKANQESLWYPLIALPEFLCVILYAAPGLIPTQKDDDAKLPQYSMPERHSG